MVYRKRPKTLSDKRPALDAMGRCRRVMISVITEVEIGGDTFQAAQGVTKSIDVMAKVLTGDETHYHAGGSSIGADERKWRDSGR